MRNAHLVVLAATLSACSLGDESLLDALADASTGQTDASLTADGSVDAGTDGGGGTDAGSPGVPTDQCGPGDILLIADSAEGIRVDTTSMVNDIGSLPGCGNLSTPGADAFLAIDVQAAEEWHFHLRVDSANDPDPSSRNPTLYLLNSSCSATLCRQELLANFCDEQQDEHFTFTFPEAGRWYVAVDDRTAGGGVYLLDAVRPVCGNDEPEHGEACEGQVGCADDCRWELSEASVQERGFNFNFKEANRVVLPATNELEIRADIGGFEGCGYPDVFAVDVPAGATLRVNQRNDDGTACTPGGTPDLNLTLRNAGNMVRGGDVVAGCPVINETFAGGGLFFVVVEDVRFDVSRPLRYRLNFELTL